MDNNAPDVHALTDPRERLILPRIQELDHRLVRLNEATLQFIRQRPGACLLLAGALGYVVGRLAARSSP